MAREFEQMRSLFALRFPGFRLDSPAPLLILAPLDEFTTKRILPEYWEHGGPKPAGVFFHGWEKEYALVRLDTLDLDHGDAFEVVYHEYIHSLLHLNVRWMPTWFDEGLAEFYGYTRFEKDKTYVGAPPRSGYRMAPLYSRPMVPLAAFLEKRESMTKDERDTALFYAQSWALTHFLIMSPGMQFGDKLNQFFNAVQRGTEQKKAFQETFGDPKLVQKNLDEYIRRFAFPAGVIPPIQELDDKSFAVRSLSLAETDAELGSFLMHTGRREEAMTYSNAAVKDDPNCALAHEELGFDYMRRGRDEDALRELKQALALDSKLYRALFATIMLSPLPHSDSPADRSSYQAQLEKVLEINNQFAPAYVELAKSYVAEGKLDRALAMSRTAEKLEPSRAGYHLLPGRILLRMGRGQDAAVLAAYVAARWNGPDRDEAMELWDAVPAAQRPAEAPERIVIADLQTAEGTIKTVSCEEKSVTYVLTKGDQTLTFRQKAALTGFADTLWYGREHFTPCYHTTGLRAAVRYKPASDNSYMGDVLTIGFRDDLPPMATVAVGQSSTTETK